MKRRVGKFVVYIFLAIKKQYVSLDKRKKGTFYTPKTILASMLSLWLMMRATFSVGSLRPHR